MARTIPAAYKTKIQKAHCRISPGSLNYTKQLGHKRNADTKNFIWGIGPEALFRMTKANHTKLTGRNCNERFNPVIQRTLSAEAKHISQPRRILLDQTN